MIKSLKLRNAQRHINAKLDFDKGVNYVVGSTDSGKSTIARSLRWALFNKPANLNLLRKKTKKTAVEVEKDADTVIRTRTKTKNTYTLNGVTKKSFGKGVPEEIEKVVDMEDYLHIQRQADPYFMLSHTPVECARELERFTDLSIITKSIKVARSEVLSLSRTFTGKNALIEEYKKQIESLSASLPSNDSIMLLKSLARKLDRELSTLSFLKEKHRMLLSLSKKLSMLGKALAHSPKKAISLKEEISVLDREIEELAGYEEKVNLLAKMPSIKKAIPDVDIEKVSEMLYAFHLVSGELLIIEDMERCDADLSNVQREIEIINVEVAKFPVCPTCKRPLDETNVHSNLGCPPDELETNLPF